MNSTDLHATIEMRQEQGLWADLRIVNRGQTPVRIHNPGNYQPFAGWEFSRQAYTVAVLLSFHVLEMELRLAGGPVVQPETVATKVDHVAGLPLELKPGGEFKVPIPLHEFYDLAPGATYVLALRYGDEQARAQATQRFAYP